MARLSFLSFGGYGDVMISWEEKNDGTVLPVLQAMLDKGVTFFILSKTKILGNPKKTAAKDIKGVQKARSIVIPDEALEQLHAAGLITAGMVVIAEGDAGNTGEIARTPEDIASAPATVAVRPPSGG